MQIFGLGRHGPELLSPGIKKQLDDLGAQSLSDEAMFVLLKNIVDEGQMNILLTPNNFTFEDVGKTKE